MRQRKLPFALLAALTLAACQRNPDDSNIAIDNGAASNVGTDDSNPSDGAAAVPPANEASPAPLPTVIPVALRGRWGINRADCTSTRGDAKGLLTISDTGLAFYESRGAIKTVIAASATSFDARYAFTGEGQSWQRTERLRIVAGQLQRRTDSEPGQEPPVDLTYLRCSA